MDDMPVDEKIPFDSEDTIKEEDDMQPDPDEELDMRQGAGRVWCVKIPKHLMEKWSAIEEEGIHLATIRVYNVDERSPKQRIVMTLAPDANGQSTDADEFEVDIVNSEVENQIVVAETPKAPGSRVIKTCLTGRIKHDCNLRPSFSDNYRKRMRERHLAANTPKRQIRLIDEVIPGGRGGVNMLSSGIAPTNGFSSLVKSKPKPTKGTFERFARMPRNQLLDVLFSLYRERPRWSAKELRSRTEQPEAYLKEVLAEIADLHRSGEFNGQYELKPNFKDSFKADPGGSSASALLQQATDAGGHGDVDADMDDEDDDEDEEDDMEEVS